MACTNDCSDRRSAKVRFSWIAAGLGFQIFQLSKIAIASCADQMSFFHLDLTLGGAGEALRLTPDQKTG